ncbi:uncharacterized protein LOC143480053 [Brachyhypopomus gauderio]|uniref:uncharacterized protein LOC143480053 n=1 Tax=Brachyhypopomus gauderio TaxID=698409 RepID=UPI004041619D
MSEYAALGALSGESFQGCEEFEEWTSYDSEHWPQAQRQSSCFDDWNCFHGDVSKNEETAHLSPQETGSSGQEHKVENSHMISPWFVFHDCFSEEEIMKDAVMVEVSPLSQLVHGSAHMPCQQTALSREATSLFHQILCDPKVLRLSGPKPNLHSQKQLISTLQLKHSDLHNLLTTDFPDLGSEELESSPGALIQTKLVAPVPCQNAPGFFYQISRQWFNQHSMKLLPHQDKKDLLQ